MKKLLRIILPVLYALALVIPAVYFFGHRAGLNFFAGQTLAQSSGLLFPLIGLYAFTLLWLQLMIGSTINPLRKIYPRVQAFHNTQGVFVLLLALLHPALLIISLGLAGYIDLITAPSFLRPFVWLGEVQLFLLIIAVLTALLRKITWLQKNWHWVHLANYVVFFSALVHSWFLGSDVAASSLKYFWLFLGLTGLIAASARLVRFVKLRSFINEQQRSINTTSQSS